MGRNKPIGLKKMAIIGALMGMIFCFTASAGAKNGKADRTGNDRKSGETAVQPASSGAGANADTKQQVRQTRMRMQKLQQKLKKIQKKVVSENPDLQKARKKYKELLDKAFKKKLSEADVDMERLKTLQAKLKKDKKKNSSLSDDKKAAIQKEFRTKAMKFRNVRRKARNDEKVQAKRRELQADMKAAMIKADPKAKEIFNELKKLHDKLQQSK